VVVGPIEDVVDSVTETVDDTVDTVTDTVEDTTEEVTGTVDETVDETVETVEEVVGPRQEGSESSTGEGRGPAVGAPGTLDGEAGNPDTDPGNRPSGSSGGHDGGVTRTRGAPALPDRRRPGDGRADGRISPSARGQTTEQQVIGLSPVRDEAVTAASASRHEDSILGRIAEAARHAAFPLALALLVMGYIALQNRLDRKDPKLAAAAIDTEQNLMHFE
jgi:hypothetical protein